MIRLLAEFILSRLLAYWSAIRLVLKATVLPVNLKYIDEEYIMKRAGDKKLSKVASTKLTVEDYELCQRIARDYYIKGNIRTPSVSELTRLALELILSTRRPSPAVDNLVNQGKIRKAPEGLAVPPRDLVRGPTPPKPPALRRNTNFSFRQQLE